MFVGWIDECRCLQSHELSFLGSSIKHLRKVFRQVNIYPLIRFTRTCAYQGVRNTSSLDNFSHIIHEWFLSKRLSGLRQTRLIVQSFRNVFDACQWIILSKKKICIESHWLSWVILVAAKPWPTILVKIFPDFLKFQHSFPSTQMEWNKIFIIRKRIYELPNNFRLRILWNFKRIPYMLGNDGDYPVGHLRGGFWQLC